MPFIGNQPALSFTSFAKQDFTTSATTSYTLDNPVANANELALFINFVRQEPTTAYSASGTSLTLTSATSVGDDMYCVFLGKAVQTVNPPNASVGTSQLVDNAVTTAKIINDAVTKDKLLSHNYPSFEAKLSGAVTLTEGVNTKVTFQTENFDTDNCYDNSTNYRFTPNVSGKYFVYSDLNCDTQQTNSFRQGTVWITKNGSFVKQHELHFNTNFARRCNVGVSGIIEMNGSSDYLEIYVNVVNGISTLAQLNYAGGLSNYFGAYRIGD